MFNVYSKMELKFHPSPEGLLTSDNGVLFKVVSVLTQEGFDESAYKTRKDVLVIPSSSMSNTVIVCEKVVL